MNEQGKSKLTEEYSGIDPKILERCMLMPTATMDTSIKVQYVQSYVHPDHSLQVWIDCLALNYEAEVFELEINYTPQSVASRDHILKIFRQESLVHVQGCYSITFDEESVAIVLHDPEYHRVAPDEVCDLEQLFLHGKTHAFF